MSIYFINEWYIFNNVIDKKTCDKIKNLGKNNWTKPRVYSGGNYTKEERLTGMKGDYKTNSEKRITDIYWFNEQWVYNIIWPFMLEANKMAGWNLEISAAESLQLARYKKGGFFSFHKDGVSDSLSAYNSPKNKLMHGKVRKISMSLILNDNFEGGALEFASYDKGKCNITPINPRVGDIIFFTSGVEHRITPVTKGIRYALINWFVGSPIR